MASSQAPPPVTRVTARIPALRAAVKRQTWKNTSIGAASRRDKCEGRGYGQWRRRRILGVGEELAGLSNRGMIIEKAHDGCGQELMPQIPERSDD